MFGLRLIIFGLLGFVVMGVGIPVEAQAVGAVRQVDCQPTKTLTIEVVPTQDPVRYDFTKKTSEINEIGRGAYSAYGADHSNTELRGLTVGKQSLSHHVDFYYEKHQDLGTACLQIRNIKVTMDYKPTVYVSTKYVKGTPIFQKILDHEMVHVKMMQNVLYDYVDRLEEHLKNSLKRGYSVGPFVIDDMGVKQQGLQDKIRKITSEVNKEMHQESQRQHDLFDDDELREVQHYNKGVARQLEKIFKIDDK